MSTDFSHLYRTLGLQPDCSVDAFRQAYRRLVSLQHPDRAGFAEQDPGQLALVDVIRMHDEAMQFHQRHGRLPGAATRLSARAGHDQGRPPSAAATDYVRAVTTASRDVPDKALASWVIWAAIAALIALPFAFWEAPSTPAAPRAVANPYADELPSTTPAQLELGMDSAMVRAIQGEPMHERDDEWNYGPSWLKFSKGRLVDWYSSPLYRLRTPTQTAPQATIEPTAPLN